MNYPKLTPQDYENRLSVPREICSVIFDSDTYNEIDDQFALTYTILAADRIRVKGMTAAPFLNSRSDSPGDGMEKSFREMLRLLKLLDCENRFPVLRGSQNFMSQQDTPVESPAVDFIINQALEHGGRGETLYIIAIAAITNVASAILTHPEIIKYITVVWLGGHPYSWPIFNEFNLRQDVFAAQVLFDSGVPLVHVPCRNVAEHVKSCPAELAMYIKGRGVIGDYLYESFCAYRKESYAMTKEIWDMAAVAWLSCPEAMSSQIVPSPVLVADKSWDLSASSRHPVRVITAIHRDSIFRDFFSLLNDHAARQGG
jgi:purine nucleosidase